MYTRNTTNDHHACLFAFFGLRGVYPTNLPGRAGEKDLAADWALRPVTAMIDISRLARRRSIIAQIRPTQAAGQEAAIYHISRLIRFS